VYITCVAVTMTPGVTGVVGEAPAANVSILIAVLVTDHINWR